MISHISRIFPCCFVRYLENYELSPLTTERKMNLHRKCNHFIVKIDITDQSFHTLKNGYRCYVRLDILRQFKTDILRRLEGVVFEKKKLIVERERERENLT